MTQALLPAFWQNLRAACEPSDTLWLPVFWPLCDWLSLCAYERDDGATVSNGVLLCENTGDWLHSCHPSRYSSSLTRHQSPQPGRSGYVQTGAQLAPPTDSSNHPHA